MEIQQAVRFGLFHILQAGARAENRPIPAKGLTGTGYDGHTFWDTETFVLPGADLHPAGRRRRRAALAVHDAATRPGARGGARPGGRGVPLADHPRRGVLRLLAGRHGRLPHQRRHRRRRGELPRRHRRTRTSSASSACRSSSRPPACGAPSASTTPTASSASRASPARTSTARSRTTTSTRT